MFNRKTRVWTVEAGDTVSKIALSVYSDQSKTIDIVNANPLIIKSSDLIIIGTQLYIPVLNHDSVKTKVDNNTTDFLLTINNKSIEFISGLKFRYGQAEGARTMAFAIPAESAVGVKVFSKVELYIKGVLFLSGILITPDVVYSKESGHFIQWQATTNIYPVIHSHFKATESNPAEWENITLKSLFKKILDPYDLNAILLDLGIGNEKIESIGFEDDEIKINFLKRVANQKNYSLQGLANGDLLLFKPKKTGEIVGKFNDSSKMQASYNYEGLASDYRAVSQKKGEGGSGSATNDLIPLNIFKTVKQDSSAGGDLAKFAKYKQGQFFAESLSLTIQVETIFNNKGTLWAPDDFISVLAKELDIPEDTTFSVDAAEFDVSNGASRANLAVILPGVRAGDLPERLPFL